MIVSDKKIMNRPLMYCFLFFPFFPNCGSVSYSVADISDVVEKKQKLIAEITSLAGNIDKLTKEIEILKKNKAGNDWSSKIDECQGDIKRKYDQFLRDLEQKTNEEKQNSDQLLSQSVDDATRQVNELRAVFAENIEKIKNIPDFIETPKELELANDLHAGLLGNGIQNLLGNYAVDAHLARLRVYFFDVLFASVANDSNLWCRCIWACLKIGFCKGDFVRFGFDLDVPLLRSDDGRPGKFGTMILNKKIWQKVQNNLVFLDSGGNKLTPTSAEVLVAPGSSTEHVLSVTFEGVDGKPAKVYDVDMKKT